MTEKKTESRHHAIMDYIGFGADRAVKRKVLQQQLDVDRRKIEVMVHDARVDGQLICANDDGYFQPTTEEEIKRWLNREQSALRNREQALMGAKKALAEGKYPSVSQMEGVVQNE